MYTEEKCKKEIFKFASILMKVYHTSFLVSFTGKKKQEVFGSEKVKKKFKEMEKRKKAKKSAKRPESSEEEEEEDEESDEEEESEEEDRVW